MVSRTWMWAVRVALATGSAVSTFAAIEGASSLGLQYVTAPPEPPAELRGKVHFQGGGAPTTPDPYLRYRIRPDAVTKEARTNAFGLRNGPVDQVPDERTVRIVILGGSTAWGLSSQSNEDTLAAILEQWFAEHTGDHPFLGDKRVEVLNAAAPGYVAWQAVLSYATDRRDLAPDVVLTLDGANEVHSAIRHLSAGWPLASVRSNPGVTHTFSKAVGAWLGYRMRSLKSVKLIGALRPEPLDPHVPPPKEVAAAYRRALEALANFTRADGALAVCALQPMSVLAGSKPLTPFESSVARQHDTSLPGRNAYYEACYEEFRRMYSEAEQRADVLTIDASRAFAEMEAMAFTDHCHLTHAGRVELVEFLGTRLVEHIDRNGLPGRWIDDAR